MPRGVTVPEIAPQSWQTHEEDGASTFTADQPRPSEELPTMLTPRPDATFASNEHEANHLIPATEANHLAQRKASTLNLLSTAQSAVHAHEAQIQKAAQDTADTVRFHEDSISALRATIAKAKAEVDTAMAAAQVETAVKAAKEAAEAQAAIWNVEREMNDVKAAHEVVVVEATAKLERARKNIVAAEERLDEIAREEERIEEERREAEARAERERLEAEAKAERERREAEARAERERLEAEMARKAAEEKALREKIEAEKARKAAEEKALKERLEAEARERERKAREEMQRKRAEALAAAERKAVAEARAAFERAEREAEEKRMEEESMLNVKAKEAEPEERDTAPIEVVEEPKEQTTQAQIQMPSTPTIVATPQTQTSLQPPSSPNKEVQEMEIRLRKMEENNQMMMQTLNAVVSMGQGFRELTKLLADGEVKNELGKSLGRVEGRELGENLQAKTKRLEELKKGLGKA